VSGCIPDEVAQSVPRGLASTRYTVSNLRLWLALGLVGVGMLVIVWIQVLTSGSSGSLPPTPLVLALFLSLVLIGVGGALIVSWVALRIRARRQFASEAEIGSATAYAQTGLTQMYPRRPPGT